MTKVKPIKSLEDKGRDQLECTVSGALYRVMWWSRCVGVAPVWFTKLNGVCEWKVQTSITAYVLSVIFVILLDFGISASPYINLNEGLLINSRTHIRWMILSSNYLIMVIWTSNAVIGGPARTMQIIRCVQRVQKVTKTINEEYINSYSHRDVNNTFVISGLSIFISFLGFAVNDWYIISVKLTTGRIMIFEVLYNNPIFIMMHLMVMMAKLQFTISSMKVFSTIRSINDVLEQIEKSSLSQNGFLCVPGYRKMKPIDEVIRHLSSLYVETCDVIEQLDSSCGCNILLLLMSCFLQLITQSYGLSQNIFIELTSYSITLSHLIWCLSQIMWLMEVVEPCHQTKLEVDRTSLLISNLSNNLTVRSISEELEKLSQYLALNQVGYSPMGVCTLSRSIIATIIANVTTYLVIIIQFQTTDVEKNKN